MFVMTKVTLILAKNDPHNLILTDPHDA